MIRLNPTWGSTNKSNAVLNTPIGLIFAYLILVNIFQFVFLPYKQPKFFVQQCLSIIYSRTTTEGQATDRFSS